jgi:hypothetical protein
MQCYRAVPGEQTLSIRLEPGHNDPGYMGIGYEQCEGPIFADSVFRNGDPLPKLGPLRRDGRVISAPCEAAAGIFNVAVHWTEDLSSPWNQRCWQSAWRKRGDELTRAEIATDAPAVAYMTVVDERGALSSSAFIGPGVEAKP